MKLVPAPAEGPGGPSFRQRQARAPQRPALAPVFSVRPNSPYLPRRFAGNRGPAEFLLEPSTSFGRNITPILGRQTFLSFWDRSEKPVKLRNVGVVASGEIQAQRRLLMHVLISGGDHSSLSWGSAGDLLSPWRTQSSLSWGSAGDSLSPVEDT